MSIIIFYLIFITSEIWPLKINIYDRLWHDVKHNVRTVLIISLFKHSIPLRFPDKSNVRFVCRSVHVLFTFFVLGLHIVVSKTYCVVFSLSSSCLPYVASVSGLSRCNLNHLYWLLCTYYFHICSRNNQFNNLVVELFLITDKMIITWNRKVILNMHEHTRDAFR